MTEATVHGLRIVQQESEAGISRLRDEELDLPEIDDSLVNYLSGKEEGHFATSTQNARSALISGGYAKLNSHTFLTLDKVQFSKFSALLNVESSGLYPWTDPLFHLGLSTSDKTGELLAKKCAFVSPKAEIAKAAVKELLDSITASAASHREQEEQLKAIKASKEYKVLMAQTQVERCEYVTPHWHPNHSGKRLGVPLYLQVVAWHSEPDEDIPGWVAVNRKPKSHWSSQYEYEEVTSDMEHKPWVYAAPFDAAPPKRKDEVEGKFCYLFSYEIATYKLYQPQQRTLQQVIFDREQGIHDIHTHALDALPIVAEKLAAAKKVLDENEHDDESPKLVSKVISLAKAQEEEEAKKLVTKYSGVMSHLEWLKSICSDIISHVEDVNAVTCKLPVTTSSTPSFNLEVYLPSDGSLTKPFTDAILQLYGDKVNLRTIFQVAPIEAVDTTSGIPKPLPQDVQARLLEMSRQDRSKSKAAAATHDDIAWRDLINGFNGAVKYHGFKPVPIHNRLAWRAPKGKTERVKPSQSAEILELRRMLEASQKQNAATLEALAGTIQTVGAAVIDLKKEETGDKGMTREEVAELLAQQLEAAETKAAEAFASPASSSRAMSEVLESPNPSGSEDGAAASHMTMLGAHWARFDPLKIEQGGAYLLVRSVHDGNLYMAPRKAEIPSGEDLKPDGLLQFKQKKQRTALPEKDRRPSQSGSDSGAKPESIATPAVRKDKQKAESKSKDSDKNGAVLTSYECPMCGVPHATKHNEDCELKSQSWGKLSTEGKRQRKAALSGAQEKPEPESGVKPAAVPKVNKIDPLKTTVTLSDSEDKKLRKYFGVSPPCKPEELEGLSVDDRRAKIQQSWLPKWAVAAVKESAENLPLILSGKLTKEHFRAGEYQRRPKKVTQPQIVAKWNALKARFEGVTLLEKPRTAKEKGFRREYDLLKALVGDHPALPKPKTSGSGGGRQGTRSPRVPQQQGQAVGQEQGLLGTLKILAEIAKILKG
jgi:hypothetical protein